MIKLIRTDNNEKHEIYYGFYDTSYGMCLLGQIKDAICHLTFVDENQSLAIAKLKKRWPKSIHIQRNIKANAKIFENMFQDNIVGSLELYVNCTDFQFSVFEALLQISNGTTVTYQNIANIVKKPKAVRAVANAIGSNRIAVLIPCHRVVSKSNNLSKYQWGSERKKKLLKMEQIGSQDTK